MAGQTIEVKPISGALGAEIAGVDLSAEIDAARFAEIRQALLDHLVIFFRDQTLTPDQQVAVGRRFGPPNRYPFVTGLKETPEIIEILKTEADETNFGGVWHSDTTYLERPPGATMLYAHDVPPAGGDTLFANACKAYDSLSDGMKALLDGLVAVNSAAMRRAGGRTALAAGNPAMKITNVAQADRFEAAHPVVRTHPETGAKALYLNLAHTERFKDMSQAESRPLIEYLSGHIVRPEFTCRFRWRAGSLALWDNRCAQHYAINDYPGQRRRMHRLTIEGERPV